jgi:aryl-alcohol dehydrogenase-like predicted oxidoreductase
MNRVIGFGVLILLSIGVVSAQSEAKAHAYYAPRATMEANYSILVRDAEKAIIQ